MLWSRELCTRHIGPFQAVPLFMEGLYRGKQLSLKERVGCTGESAIRSSLAEKNGQGAGHQYDAHNSRQRCSIACFGDVIVGRYRLFAGIL